jgi:hypothetical protein
VLCLKDVGADCSDHPHFDNNLNDEVSVGGDVVLLNEPGTYKVEYYCSSMDGRQTTSASRVVIVNEKYSPGCSSLELTAGGAVGGQYILQKGQTNDGKPIYKQRNGCRCHYLYYFSDSSKDQWMIQNTSLAEIQNVHYNEHPHPSGMYVASHAPRAEDIRSRAWKVYHTAASGGGGGWHMATVRATCTDPSLAAPQPPHYTVSGVLTIRGYDSSAPPGLQRLLVPTNLPTLLAAYLPTYLPLLLPPLMSVTLPRQHYSPFIPRLCIA